MDTDMEYLKRISIRGTVMNIDSVLIAFIAHVHMVFSSTGTRKVEHHSLRLFHECGVTPRNLCEVDCGLCTGLSIFAFPEK